jgi:hypothetical protein
MRLLPNGSKLAQRLAERWRRETDLRVLPVRTVPLPVTIVRKGDNYAVKDGLGRVIGTIRSPGHTPRLGRNEETVYLWREN